MINAIPCSQWLPRLTLESGVPVFLFTGEFSPNFNLEKKWFQPIQGFFMGKKKTPKFARFSRFLFLSFPNRQMFYCKFQIASQEYRRILYLFLLSYLVHSQIWLNLFCGWSALWLHHHKVLKRRNPGLESGLRGQKEPASVEHVISSKIQIPRTRGFQLLTRFQESARTLGTQEEPYSERPALIFFVLEENKRRDLASVRKLWKSHKASSS